MASLPTNIPRLIKLAEVKRRSALSTTEIYRRMADGRFPPQVRLGVKGVAWLESEVDAWIHERITDRDSLQAGGRA